MSTTTDTTCPAHDESLPTFPLARDARCPFDPPAQYADWRRENGPRRAMFYGEPVWVASRFADIRAALTDPRMSADNTQPGFPSVQAPADHQTPPSFTRMDDPEHARLRRMLTGEFTVKRVGQMRPQIQELVNEFLDKMVEQGQPADLVSAFALPVPSMVICLLLGVPYEDHEYFQGQSTTLLSQAASGDEKSAAINALYTYMLGLVERKEREPDDALLSRLVRERVETGELSREELAMNSMTLLFAGHETTANMIGLSTLTLLENPEQLTRVRDTEDPALVAGAVEELLRYLTIPLDVVVRVAVEDLTIGDQLIRAGEGMVMNLPAGNRDAAFVDRPDTFDIDRSARGHLSFGYGVHQCLGQSLARAELEIALPTLLRRLPGLRLTVPFEQVEFRYDMSTYGVRALPVTW
jgi:cytochrome P450